MTALVPQFVVNIWNSVPLTLQNLTIIVAQILAVTICVILTVAFSTYFERKIIGHMQGRMGPNRVGPLGLLQPFADVIKLLIKEVVVPTRSNRFLFIVLRGQCRAELRLTSGAFEEHDLVTTAITREKTIKKWPRQWKINAIEAINPDWNDLRTWLH